MVDDFEVLEALVKEIRSKLDEGVVKFYALKEETVESDEHRVQFEIAFPQDEAAAWMLLGYLVVKKRSRLVNESPEGVRTYKVLSRKGKATLVISVERQKSVSKIGVKVRGDREVAQELADFLKKEIEDAIDARS